MQTLVCQGMLPDKLEVSFWQMAADEDAFPGGHQVAMVSAPEHLRKARLVCKAWRDEVHRYLEAQVDAVSRDILLRVVPDGLELCNVDQYPNRLALPKATNIVYSVFLGKQEVLAVFMTRRRVAGSDNELAHEFVVQCGALPMPEPESSHVSPAKVVPLPELCWTSAADFTPEQMQEHEDWHHALCQELEDWLAEQLQALRAAAPFSLLFE